MSRSRWILRKTDTFKRLYRSKPVEIQRKVDEALRLLAESENPLLLGKKKKPFGFRAYELTSKERLAYHMEDGVIVLDKVCDHKLVYGHDR